MDRFRATGYVEKATLSGLDRLFCGVASAVGNRVVLVHMLPCPRGKDPLDFLRVDLGAHVRRMSAATSSTSDDIVATRSPAVVPCPFCPGALVGSPIMRVSLPFGGDGTYIGIGLATASRSGLFRWSGVCGGTERRGLGRRCTR